MTLTQKLLAGVVAAEVLAAGAVLAPRLGPPAPPAPDLTHVDPATAADLEARTADLRTPAAWGRLGEELLAAGYFPESERCLQRATELDPTSANWRFKHAFVLERLGRLDEADAGYRAAAAAGSRRAADCWYSVGRNRLRVGDAAAAAEAFGKCGDHPAARYELARLHERAGRTDQARELATKLAADFPRAMEPVSLLYRLAVAGGDAAGAATLADRFDHAPDRLPAPFKQESDWVYATFRGFGRGKLRATADAAFQAGRLPEAERALRAVLAAGWEPEPADQLAETVFHQGRPAEAAELLADAVARTGPAFGLLWRRGQALKAAGDPAGARAAWERADRVVSGPWAKELWDGLAAAAEARNDPAAAGYRGRAALAAGMLAVQAGKPSEAAGPLTTAAGVPETRAAAWFYLGEAARADNRSADARAAYEKCLGFDPDHGRARRALGLVGR